MKNNIQDVSVHQKKQKLMVSVQKNCNTWLLFVCLSTGFLFCSLYRTDNHTVAFAEKVATTTQTSRTGTTGQFKYIDNETGVSIIGYTEMYYHVERVAGISISIYENRLVVPASIDGKSVTVISKFAFLGCGLLQSATISENVTTIEQWAFENCQSLESVVIPKSVTTIDQRAFAGCASLKSWDISPENPNYKSDGMSLLSKDGKTLIACPAASENFTLPNGVTTIGDFAFYNCKSLRSIVIPNDVTTIRTKAFVDCKSLQSVVIPASVTTIYGGAFAGCDSLKSVQVSSDNPNYKSEGTVLLSKDGKTLVSNTTASGEYIIPDGVTTIGEFAFLGSWHLESVVIPDSVTTIEEHAFSGCSIIIRTPKGSKAEEYAKKHGYKVEELTPKK